MPTLYEILELAETATQEQIRAAYKKLALVYHPDRNPDNPDAEEKFKEINRAHQILSNPYQKAAYDLQLRFGEAYAPQEEPIYETPYRRPPHTHQRAEPELDYRENWIATAYAFAFTGVIAVIVLIFIGIKNWYDDKVFTEKLTARYGIFQEARLSHERGDYRSAIEQFNTLGAFYPEEASIAEYKSALITEMLIKGRIHFDTGAYLDALYYFEIIDQKTSVGNLLFKENMALAYKWTDQPEKAIEVLNQFMINGYRQLFTLIELAEIYRELVGDSLRALAYLEKGNLLAKTYYEEAFGKAYSVIVSSRNIPDLHHRLYVNLAETYLRVGNPEKALSTIVWNTQIWPDRYESFYIAARAYEKLNKKRDACKMYQKAKSLAPDLSIPAYCR